MKLPLPESAIVFDNWYLHKENFLYCSFDEILSDHNDGQLDCQLCETTADVALNQVKDIVSKHYHFDRS